MASHFPLEMLGQENKCLNEHDVVHLHCVLDFV